jgi:hypothetical protein
MCWVSFAVMFGAPFHSPSSPHHFYYIIVGNRVNGTILNPNGFPKIISTGGCQAGSGWQFGSEPAISRMATMTARDAAMA